RCVGLFVVFFFFFSSRRRHTRFSRDWSSDVCSSDLFEFRAVGANPSAARTAGMSVSRATVLVLVVAGALAGLAGSSLILGSQPRSEERRVGKECRSRRSAEHSKRKRRVIEREEDGML